MTTDELIFFFFVNPQSSSHAHEVCASIVLFSRRHFSFCPFLPPDTHHSTVEVNKACSEACSVVRMARNVRVGKDLSPHFLGGPCFSVPELENW